jgi:hypothetical protein
MYVIIVHKEAGRAYKPHSLFNIMSIVIDHLQDSANYVYHLL